MGNSNSNSNNNNKYTMKQKKKEVRFAPTCSVKHTIAINDMTEEEIQRTWLSEKEQHEIRQRCKELAKEYYTNTLPAGSCHSNKETEETYRGLESFTPLGKRRKRTNRHI